MILQDGVSAPSLQAASRFAKLKSAISKGDVLVPGDADYEDSLKRWSATCIKPAAVVVRPRTAAEASTAVTFATENSIPLTVRGGGHSPSGSSASSGGMVIDLNHIRHVSVDKSKQTVTFGGGCLWGEVDAALWEHGLATVGGTVSHTGVGGLILGGGYGMLTGRHGLSVDVLLSCEVVLADGSIVTASKTENPDLFWALRGAGHSFGVVTEFTSRAFPQDKVWGGILAWPVSRLAQVVDAINELAVKTNGDQHVLTMITSHPKTGEPVVAAASMHNGPTDEAKEVFESLLAIPDRILDTTGMIPYPISNTFPDAMMGPGKRYIFSGANFLFPLDFAMVKEVADIFHGHLAVEGNEEMKATSMVGFEFAPRTKLASVPASDMAFAGRHPDTFNVIIALAWLSEEKDDEVRQLCARLTNLLKERGWKGDASGDRGGTYLNYLHPAVEEDRAYMRADRVFGPNAQRLRDLKLVYDPDNVFKKNVDLLPRLNGSP